jgi:hypothetical protein
MILPWRAACSFLAIGRCYHEITWRGWMTISKRAGFAAGFVALVSVAAPVAALNWSVLASKAADPCVQPQACVIVGAEVDDEATIKARARVGTGPAVGIASDRRIKSDIKEIGRLENGIKIYSFKYIWEDKVRVGVIAQDLLERPDTKDAVLTLANGLLGVDYAAIGLRMASEQQWLDSGMAAVKSDYVAPKLRFTKLDDTVRLYNQR